MELTPEELERATFPLVKRGYDPEAVQRFLAEVAARLRQEDDFRRAGDEVATALRGLHDLLTDMKSEAEEEALRIRTEAEQEAFRVRTEAEQQAVRMHNDAVEEIRQLQATAEANAARIRSEAERERDELMAHAQSEVRNMLEEARAERQRAEQLTEAADRTLAARRTELEEYLSSIATLAEHTARARAAAVIDGYAEEVDRLVQTKQRAAEALTEVKAALDKAVSALRADVDLTGDAAPTDDHALEIETPPTEDEIVAEVVTTTLDSVTSPLESRPGQLL